MNMVTEMRKSIEALTGVKVAPQGHASIPGTTEYIRIALVDEIPFDTGLVRQSLVAAHYQIDFISPNFERVLEMEKSVWREWRNISHSYIGECPVQYIEKGRIQQDYTPDNNGGLYRHSRVFIIYYNNTP